MGTTLTAVYVGEHEVSIAHVGDSRAYRLRDGELLRLTDDHSLVDELLRQGRLTPEEAVEHPQRSVITRALGPEGVVEVDTRSYSARDGDVYLLCSDGLTTMLPEDRLAEVLRAHPALRDAGEALIAAANEAGGRDNITVVLMRLEELDASASPLTEDGPPRTAASADAAVDAPAAAAPRAVAHEAPERGSARRGSRRRPRLADGRASRRRVVAPAPATRRTLAGHAVVLAVLGAGAYLALQSVYFIGTNSRGLVTVFRGVPYRLPGNLALYSSDYVSGVSASTLTASAGARCSTTRCARKPTRPRCCAASNWGSSNEARAMNQPIVRLFGLVIVMFALLLAFTSRWTIFEASSLRDNPLNARGCSSSSASTAAGSSPPTARCSRAACAARKASTNAPIRPAKSSRTRSATPTSTWAGPGWSVSATPR